ncbi:MAG: putative motility protein [Deltaproteobacteria bacterium]|nr:putative motility protein [Deltaproteobacteria bacterium]
MTDLSIITSQLAAARFRTEAQVAVAKKTLDIVKLEGEAAIKLIEAAAPPAPPDIGANVDVFA